VYDWLKVNASGDRKSDQTDEQFYYKTRKKGFGPFKNEHWSLPAEVMNPIMKDLEDEFELLFGKLNVFDTKDLVSSKIKEVFVPKAKPLCLL
jgi:hypothetical protein